MIKNKNNVIIRLYRYHTVEKTFEIIYEMEDNIRPICYYHICSRISSDSCSNDFNTVSTYEIEFGDNDRLSAIVSGLIQADLLILLSDIDGLFTDDPNKNSEFFGCNFSNLLIAL